MWIMGVSKGDAGADRSTAKPDLAHEAALSVCDAILAEQPALDGITRFG